MIRTNCFVNCPCFHSSDSERTFDTPETQSPAVVNLLNQQENSNQTGETSPLDPTSCTDLELSTVSYMNSDMTLFTYRKPISQFLRVKLDDNISEGQMVGLEEHCCIGYVS